MIKKFIKETLKYLPARIIPAVIGIIAIPIVTRLFHPTDYGNYALVISTVTILSALVGWVSMGIIRFYPAYERDGKLNKFYTTTTKCLFLSIGILTLLFYIGLLLSKNFISKDLYKLMYVGIFVFVFSALFGVLSSFLQIKRLVSWYSGIFSWKSSASLAIGLILVVSLKFGIEGLLWGIVLSILLILPWLWKKAVGKFFLKQKISKFLAKEMVSYSIPLMLAGLAAQILSLSDRYVLNFFRNAWEVGIYSISYSIPQKSLLLIIGLFLLSARPLSMHIWEKQGKREARAFIAKTTRYFLIIMLPMTIGLIALARPVFDLLVAREYHMGCRILPPIAVGVLFLGLSQRFGIGLNLYKKTVLDMWAIVIATVANLGLNFIFVPKYGYVAAAITTLICYALMLFLRIYFSRKFFVWKFPFQSLLKCVLASIIMGGGIYFLAHNLYFPVITNLILGILFGTIFYFLLLFLFKEIQAEEKEVIKNFVKAKFISFKIKKC